MGRDGLCWTHQPEQHPGNAERWILIPIGAPGYFRTVLEYQPGGYWSLQTKWSWEVEGVSTEGWYHARNVGTTVEFAKAVAIKQLQSLGFIAATKEEKAE